MIWLKKYAPILALIAFAIIGLYFVIATLFVSSEILFPIFSRYAYPLRGMFDVCTIIATFMLPAIVICVLYGEPLENALCFFKRKWLNYLLIVITLIGTVNIPFAYFDIGTTQIKNFFEQRVYSEEYYVEINGNKIPATIFRSHNSQGIVYILEKMKYGNSTINFTYTEALDFMPSWEIDYVIPNVKTIVTTDEGRSFAVTLTTERVK